MLITTYENSNEKDFSILFVACSIGAIEKNNNLLRKHELSDEEKNLLQYVQNLPRELKEKIIHHIHEEHYVEPIDSYVTPRYLREYKDIYSDNFFHWLILRKQNSIRFSENQFTINKIPFDVTNAEESCQEAFSQGPSAHVGPNKQGVIMFERTCKVFQFPYNKALTYHPVKYIGCFDMSCIHPSKNKSILVLPDYEKN